METIDPEEIIFSITVLDLVRAIERRLGEEALSLSVEDLQLAIDEIKAVIEDQLDIRDYIDMGLDAWELTRNL